MKYYFEIDSPIKDMPASELQNLLKGQKKSKIMRTIIMNEKKFLSVNYDRSLRGFWYLTVKPVLEKLGLLTETDQTEKKLEKWDQELSRYMGELVKNGTMTYKDLRIVDQSRKRGNPKPIYHTVNSEIYGYKVGLGAYPHIIISTEKDTVYSIIEGVASFFGCSCISGKGQNALSAMEDLLRGMGNVQVDIYILTLTDYDPSGYYIADTFRSQAVVLKEAMGIQSDVYIERIGIFPSQLTQEEIENNKYTPKPVNLDKWFGITGGINGESKGLELDALPPDRIRDIFVTSLKKYIDPKVYEATIKESYIKMKVLEVIKSKVETILSEVKNSEIDNITNSQLDIFSLAKEGHVFLPIEDLCNDDRDSLITEKTKSYFR